MEIRVKCYATLRDMVPTAADDHSAMTVEPSATVADLLQALAVPTTIPVVILVNGNQAQPQHRLAAGDLVDLFPPIAGG